MDHNCKASKLGSMRETRVHAGQPQSVKLANGRGCVFGPTILFDTTLNSEAVQTSTVCLFRVILGREWRFVTPWTPTESWQEVSRVGQLSCHYIGDK